MDLPTERMLWRCIRDVVEGQRNEEPPVVRSRKATMFRLSRGHYGEQRFGLAARGGTGFASYVGILTDKGVHFVPVDFCRYLVEFLCISPLFYERKIRFYGSCVLEVNLVTPPAGAYLFDGFPSRNGQEYLKGAELFDPPLRVMNFNGGTQIEVPMFPMTSDRRQDCLEAVLIDLVRPNGSVLSSKSQEGTQALVDSVLQRLNAAREE